MSCPTRQRPELIFFAPSGTEHNFLLKCDYLAHLVVHDLPVGLDKALGVEGGLPIEHLVHANTQRPPVALGPVPPLACKVYMFIRAWARGGEPLLKMRKRDEKLRMAQEKASWSIVLGEGGGREENTIW